MARHRPSDSDWTGKAYMMPPRKQSEPDDPKSAGAPERDESLGGKLLDCAYNNGLKLAKSLLERQAPIDFVHLQTGLTALHIAVGRDHLDVAKLLVESGASFLPDKQGRTPSVIAAECEVSDEMCDFIAEAEAKADGV